MRRMCTLGTVLQSAQIKPSDRVREYPFQGRATISALVVHEGETLFVKSARGGSWTLPQGEIEFARDRTWIDAAVREVREEANLRMHYIDRRKPGPVLGEFLNPMPENRHVGYTHKHIVFVTIPVWMREWVELNEENTSFSWVGSYGHVLHLLGGMAETRPYKFRATCDALNRAHKAGLIPWSCDPGLVLAA